ncbi:alkaline and neutral invertase-like protein [Chitinophaga dinghuensis]|uniref:beta-fructofuranosidase n=1 Tax=Chitinophaga dinghuensis TaxID=1539050 RepID=A0A327VMJ5_9BACT|nr:glycoside hydrolase 100 family protein [Chitinophaga dinghuensis]RAJ76575.1 alkaline and neutral invertase-like protein [Chitinophaga dinghuensis]
MQTMNPSIIAKAKAAALEVLLYNVDGPYDHLPRTAAWGYPEPYTRDLLISLLGIGVSGNEVLMNSMRRVLESLAENQSPHGHMPSLVHEPADRGSSDSTPLFLLAIGIYRQLTGHKDFLAEAVTKALTWMEYQSPTDEYLVAQQPTSDWRDEQWVLGYGLFVNTITYSYLRILGLHDGANGMLDNMKQFTITSDVHHAHVHEGLSLENKPYYALWSYKVMSSERFDLLGNSIAILCGIAEPDRAKEMVAWIEGECQALKEKNDLVLNLPPNFFPYIQPGDLDWHKRYVLFNMPGEYHNGGLWPFVCGFYVAALVAAEEYELAEAKLMELTNLISLAVRDDLEFGFNEWVKAQDGKPKGQDWQTWSAAMYLYAAACVEQRSTPFFDAMRDARCKEI